MVKTMELDNCIKYDEAELLSMDIKQLAVQIIARLDLRTPDREAKLKFRRAFEEARREMQAILTDVASVGIPELETGIQAIIRKYFGREQEVVV